MLLLNQIYASIMDVAGRHRDFEVDRRTALCGLLDALMPATPADGTRGFIAYTVGTGKPRLKLRTARFLTRKLRLNSGFLSDSEIRAIADEINKAVWPDNIEVRLDSGLQIVDNYRDTVGGSSCMTGRAAIYTRLYADNPDRYSQLVMCTGRDSARAIVIKLDNGRFLMDRIYSTSSFLRTEMFKHAQESGWLYRTSTNPGVYHISHDNGIEFASGDYSQIIVSDLQWEPGYVPYQDLLTVYRLDRSNRLTLLHPRSGLGADGDTNSASEDGELSEQGSLICDHCGDGVDADDAIPIRNDTYCPRCVDDLFRLCSYCDEYCRRDDAVRIEDIGDYWCVNCADSHAFYCEHCGETYSEETHQVSAVLFGHIVELCTDCADNPDNQYAPCADCGVYHEKQEIYPETGLCSDCAFANTAELPFTEKTQ